MNTQTLILAILNFGDTTGYEIKKHSTEGAFSYFVDISFGSIYPTLSKLEAEDLVTCRSEVQSGKPDKKVYSITEKGRLEFIATLAQPPAPDKFKSEFLLVAMCADQTSPQIIEKAIDQRIGQIEAQLEMVRGILQECDHPLTKWITNYGIHVKQADLQYLNDNRETLIMLASTSTPNVEAAE